MLPTTIPTIIPTFEELESEGAAGLDPFDGGALCIEVIPRPLRVGVSALFKAFEAWSALGPSNVKVTVEELGEGRNLMSSIGTPKEVERATARAFRSVPETDDPPRDTVKTSDGNAVERGATEVMGDTGVEGWPVVRVEVVGWLVDCAAVLDSVNGATDAGLKVVCGAAEVLDRGAAVDAAVIWVEAGIAVGTTVVNSAGDLVPGMLVGLFVLVIGTDVSGVNVELTVGCEVGGLDVPGIGVHVGVWVEAGVELEVGAEEVVGAPVCKGAEVVLSVVVGLGVAGSPVVVAGARVVDVAVGLGVAGVVVAGTVVVRTVVWGTLVEGILVVGTLVEGILVVGTLVVGRVGAAVVQGSKFVPDGICGMHQEGNGVEGATEWVAAPGAGVMVWVLSQFGRLMWGIEPPAPPALGAQLDPKPNISNEPSFGMDPLVWVIDPLICGMDPLMCGIEPEPKCGIDPLVWCVDPLIWGMDPLMCGIEPEPKCGIDPLVWCVDPLIWGMDPLMCGIEPEPKCGIDPLVWCVDPLIWGMDPLMCGIEPEPKCGIECEPILGRHDIPPGKWVIELGMKWDPLQEKSFGDGVRPTTRTAESSNSHKRVIFRKGVSDWGKSKAARKQPMQLNETSGAWSNLTGVGFFFTRRTVPWSLVTQSHLN
jgi:hypothetical protein